MGFINPVETTSERTTGLRRAEYVCVLDLVPNIDMEKLKREMAKIKQGSLSSTLDSSSDRNNSLGKSEAFEAKYFSQKYVPPSGGYNMCLLVGKVDLVVDKVRVDKSRVRLAEVEVSDETGTVSLRARDEQIDVLKEVSQRKNGAIVLRNCTLEMFQGKHLRVAITKWGKMKAHPDNIESTPSPPLEMNNALNISMVDLNVVVRKGVTRYSSTVLPGQHDEPSPPASISIAKVNLSQLQHGGQDHIYGDKLSSTKLYTEASAVHKANHIHTELNYASLPLQGNPNIFPNINSFSPVYGGSQLFGYNQTQLLEGQRLPGQHISDHQKQQQLILFQMQQMQLYQHHQHERHRQIFHTPGHQNTSPEVTAKRVGSLSATNSNFTLETNPSDRSSGTRNQILKSDAPFDTSEEVSRLLVKQGEELAAPSKSQSDIPVVLNNERQFGITSNRNPQNYGTESWAGFQTGIEAPLFPRMNPKAASFAPSSTTAVSHASQNEIFHPQHPPFINSYPSAEDKEYQGSSDDSVVVPAELSTSVTTRQSSS